MGKRANSADVVSIPPTERLRWKALTSSFLDHNYQHTWAFAVLASSRHGATIENVEIRDGTETIGAASVRIRRVPLLGAGIAYVSRGPLCRRSGHAAGDTSDFRRCVERLREEYARRRGLILRIHAPLGSSAWNEAAEDVLADMQFCSTPWPDAYRTLVVDTTVEPDDIRSRFSRYWRRNVRRAEERNVRVEVSSDPQRFELVETLHRELLERKDFDVELDAAFYRRVQESLDPDERFLVLTAYHDDTPLGVTVLSPLGDTMVGVIGALSRGGAKQYAGYAIYWRAITLANEMGKRCFDWGGIDPEENESVYKFKLGTRGLETRAAGPAEIRAPGARHSCVLLGERVFRRARALVG